MHRTSKTGQRMTGRTSVQFYICDSTMMTRKTMRSRCRAGKSLGSSDDAFGQFSCGPRTLLTKICLHVVFPFLVHLVLSPTGI
jgi:hypothetical protein